MKKIKTNLDSILQEYNVYQESEKLAGVGSWVWDIEKDIWTFSDNWLNIHGVKENCISSSELLKIAHPDEIHKIKKALDHVIKNHKPYTLEHRIINQDTGEMRYIKAHGKVIESKDKKVKKLVGSALDITEIRKAKQQVEEQEKIFNSIYNNSPTGIFRSTRGGTVLSANSAFLKIYGFNNLEELHEVPAQEYYTDSGDREKLIGILKKHGKVKDFITKERKKDQTEIWVKTNYSAVKNTKGEIVYIDGLVEDITNSKKAENDLLSQNALFRSLTKILQNKFDNQIEMLDYTLDQAIALTESKIGYIYYYDEEKKQFTLNTWSGDVMKECDIVDPKTIYEFDSTGCWGEAVRQRKPYINNNYSTDIEFERGIPEGHIQLKKILTVPIFDQHEIKAVVGVANKENDYKEEDIDQLTLLMNAVWKIVEQNKYQNELKIAKEKAEQSEKLKTMFLNNLSHEIRTPLNGILGFSKLLNKENLSPDTRKEYTEIVNDSSTRLMKVVEDIIDISLIETDQMEINLSSLNLWDFISEIANEHKTSNLFKSKPNIQLKLNNSIHKSQVLEADKLRLKQVVDNLISNALKWSDDGAIEVGCIYENSNQIRIYVKDEGQGIPEDQKHKLFKRFSKIETEELVEGTGLGLAISKGIIDLLGGNIEHEDNKPRGSVFSITLPATQTKHEISPEDTEIQKPESTNNSLVYIAEDDEISIEFLDILLSEIEINTRFAKNGEELLALIEKEIPDLILMDIRMPKLNGFEALAIIKEKYPKIKVIAQTAHAMGAEKNKIMEAGFDDYISKPIDEEKLMKLLTKHFKQTKR